MYIVRWLTGHPIIATWILGLIAISLTLGSDQKENIIEQDNAKTEHSEIVTGSAEQGAVDIAIDTASSQKPIEELKDNGSSLTSSEIEKNAKSSVSLANEVAKETVSAVDAKIQPEAEVERNKKEISSSTEEVIKEKTETKQEAQINSAIKENNASKTEPVSSVVTDLGYASTEEMLQMAREAYWNNGLDEAVQIYTKLIELEPKIVEHRGELGNVYWKQGYPKKAAGLYSEISIPMIEKGDSDRVANMIGFIGLFYPDRAADIQKRIQSGQVKNQ